MKKESFSLSLPEIKTILLLKNNYPKAIECLKEKIQERDKIKIDSIYYSVIEGNINVYYTEFNKGE